MGRAWNNEDHPSRRGTVRSAPKPMGLSRRGSQETTATVWATTVVVATTALVDRHVVHQSVRNKRAQSPGWHHGHHICKSYGGRRLARRREACCTTAISLLVPTVGRPFETDCSSENEWFIDSRARRVYKQYVIEDLCLRPYWGRMWILQEYILAQQVTLWCADQTFSNADIHNVDKSGQQILLPRYPGDTHRSSRAVKVMEWRNARQFSPNAPPGMSLTDVLDEFGCHNECGDVRDRVFALLSLMDVEERDSLGLSPDYAMTPTELFQDIYIKLRSVRGESGAVRTVHSLARALQFDKEAENDVVKKLLPDFYRPRPLRK